MTNPEDQSSVAAGWTGRLAQFRDLVSEGSLASTVRDSVAAIRPTTDSEFASWASSWRALSDALSQAEFDDLQVILELDMPIGAERADVILLGGSDTEPRALVVELKQWTNVGLTEDAFEVEVPGHGLHQHPSLQALNYRGKLHLFHAEGSRYAMHAAGYLHNMSANQLGVLKRAPQDWISEAPLFGVEDRSALADHVRALLLPASLHHEAHQTFAAAPFIQSRHLFDVIRRRAKEIAEGAYAALADEGVGLTEEQSALVAEVLASIDEDARRVFVVEGGPGSGKTLLAVTLLLQAIERGQRCVIGLRNNRLQAILKRCFDQAYRGASGLLMYFEVPRSGTGIGDSRFRGSFDLLILDEAQRIKSSSIEVALGRAPVSVVFLDEGQRLNPPEQGTMSSFVASAQRLEATVETRRLTGAVRCLGGRPYHDWVEHLLGDEGTLKSLSLSAQPWTARYEVAVVESATKLLDELARRRDEKAAKVALVASFTESAGYKYRLRLGFPLESGWDRYKIEGPTVEWLMSPNDYIRFWLAGESSRLERCASIYGAQGFESDYVGVIWGRDLVRRGDRWQLGDPSYCFDTIEGLITRGRPGRWSADALPLLINRYRIFLTRGIRGTLIYCEDDETRAFLESLNALEGDPLTS